MLAGEYWNMYLFSRGNDFGDLYCRGGILTDSGLPVLLCEEACLPVRFLLGPCSVLHPVLSTAKALVHSALASLITLLAR